MSNELPTVDEFLENAQLKSYDSYHQPAYYDEEFRNKTVELAEKFDSNIFIETGSGKFFEPARKLFKSCGFKECDPFSHYKNDPNSCYMKIRV